MRLSDAQSRAIAHGTGPAMVLAGPGSGKTLVITQRTKKLIEERQVSPSQILVITFTRAAAEEMRQRFAALCKARGVIFGTFHGVYFGMLKQAYCYTSANILGEEKKLQLLRALLRSAQTQADRGPEEEKELLTELAGEISLVKNGQIDLDCYCARSCPEDLFRDLYRRYERERQRMGLLDFDDMLVCTYELLNARPDILEGWRRRFSYILVDEFQDINLLQYKIVQMLAAPRNNLFIVGDDDQSIYLFRGAKPEIMLNFTRDYPDAATIALDKNFRSDPSVIRGAQQVIGKNKNRLVKKAEAVWAGKEKLDLREFANQSHESLCLVKCIKESMENGVLLSEIAVLFRTNHGAGPFAERMMEFNLPFAMRDAAPNLYDHWIAGDILAYLHLAHEGTDRGQFLQVMNRPKRYISRESVHGEKVSFVDLKAYYRDRDWMVDRIDRMEFDLNLLGQMTPYAAVNFIRNGIHYEDYLTEYAKMRKMKPEELTDLLEEIQEGAKPYRSYEEWLAHLAAYRRKLEESRAQSKRQEEAVTFATLHGAKGLEFREVFLVDVNEGVIPHKKALAEADIEEERRLLYVGMTRAKEKLHLFYTAERFGKAAEPSPFLDVLLRENGGHDT